MATLVDVLQNSWLPCEVHVQTLNRVASVAFGSLVISFTDDELAPPEYRTTPLYITAFINEKRMGGILVDTGSALNVCPLHSLEMIRATCEQL